ncbi:arginase family protein [Asanoa iriomotensis]|uniref:Arginase n=1 Tax=Asanoa iriomotensis TaxID=234613 RepID=A0ABQ4BTR9_9ACTN|nr:arginase family protein [Asanoa iriomotensis]GIF53929.1 hypothetical protein Air01nite_00240 [Asanoa iriomotensis]
MTILRVPFHQDRRLPDESLPLDAAAVTIEPALPDGTVWERLTALHTAVAERVAREVVPTVVSGDCLVALGTLAGVQRAGIRPGLVWFDAHGDVHTLDTTTSGYLGGLALRLALGAHADLVAGPLGLRPVPVEHTLLVGARDLDRPEVDYLASGNAPATRAVGDLGELPDGPLVLHVDLDVIDAGELPGLRFPAPGGPSSGAVRAAIQHVLSTGRVVAVNIACPWHEAPDPAAQAARTNLLANLAS